MGVWGGGGGGGGGVVRCMCVCVHLRDPPKPCNALRGALPPLRACSPFPQERLQHVHFTGQVGDFGGSSTIHLAAQTACVIGECLAGNFFVKQNVAMTYLHGMHARVAV